jgi:hypothetical protein
MALKKHPKVMNHLIGGEKEVSKVNKIDPRKASKPEQSECIRYPSNSRNSANAINDELRRVKRSYDLRSRSRDAEVGTNSSGVKENPSSGRVLSRGSGGIPLPKGSSEVRLKPSSGSNRGHLDLVSVHAGIDSLVTRKPSQSSRQLKDHQMEELDRINRRLDMMNKQILIEKGGPGLLGIRRKPVQEEAFSRGHPH